MTGLLAGKRLLITGVLTEASIAFHTAKHAQEQGADVVLTGFGRLSLVQRVANRLPRPAPVVELDVQDATHLDTLAARVRDHTDRLDGVLHAIGFAPPSCLGAPFLDSPREDVSVAIEVSAFSFKSLVVAVKPLLGPGAAIVGLNFDGQAAWPAYNWMGVAKAALECVNRYLARDLGRDGIRVNLVTAGPLRTVAASAIPGFTGLEEGWTARAPLGWNAADPGPVARTVCAVLSDWLPATTGSLIAADGGVLALAPV
ncbi:enoyl-ACP reductase FabI [Amycolatopsis sp. NBC_01488]|uniref:enoyl-ACP reductase FabI n=1 Tax=Amycolatopsis sp. NBC_01488 TaxID=2903563 RepID=UPI002E2C30CB|nr:enoyl-ACP reductase FabI [Amycolatopsis sp. NBC_01488]